MTQTNSKRPWRCAIDFHAHIMIPEMYAVTRGYSMFAKSNTAPGLTEAGRKQLEEREKQTIRNMSDVTERIGEMDRMGVDMQLLSSSLVHQCTYWTEPQESLKLERKLNDHVAGIVQGNPKRFIGLGGVPLHAPDLAVPELRRCMNELKLAGVGISTTARQMELGDTALRPFWQTAEELGAVVYIHPAGNHDPRFQKWHLWNSIGQTFEEAMAIASLFVSMTNRRSGTPPMSLMPPSERVSFSRSRVSDRRSFLVRPCAPSSSIWSRGTSSDSPSSDAPASRSIDSVSSAVMP